MNVDTMIIPIVGVALAIFVLGVLLRFFKQPYVVIYILAGIVIGPFGFGLVKDGGMLSQLGSLGIVLMLFFVGMHVSLPRLVSNWKVAIIGTFGQILASVGISWIIGNFLGWEIARIILLGFVISLSSTALVVKVLEDRDELNTKVGQNALVITIIQDFAVIPMLIILDILKGTGISTQTLGLQMLGGAIIITLLVLSVKGKMRLPFGKIIKQDHEMQVFVALILCFGLALISSWFGISSAMGAFIAGIVVSQAKETHWVQSRLESLRVIFVGLFFIYIGAIIDLTFLWQNLIPVLILVISVFAVNTAISSGILRSLGSSWASSIYTGSLLSQIGEFSFLLGAIGFQRGIITQYTYQLCISVISLTLLLTPFWITLVRRYLKIDDDIIFRIANKQDSDVPKSIVLHHKTKARPQ